MGAVVPAILATRESDFTPLDRDGDSLTEVCATAAQNTDESAIHADLQSVDISRRAIEAKRLRLRRIMASAALAMMDSAGVNLLDADFDPWSVGAPANHGFVDHRAIEPSEEQMKFTHTLESVRNIITSNLARPLTAFTAVQAGPTPRDAILLNLLFYLSTDGFMVQTKSEPQPEGTYAVHVIVS